MCREITPRSSAYVTITVRLNTVTMNTLFASLRNSSSDVVVAGVKASLRPENGHHLVSKQMVSMCEGRGKRGERGREEGGKR